MKKSKKEIITEIQFYPIIPSNGVVCFISLTYQNLRINDIAIVTRPLGGYRISYPIKKLNNGKVVQSVYPITHELGNKIEKQVLLAYTDFLRDNVKGESRA